MRWLARGNHGNVATPLALVAMSSRWKKTYTYHLLPSGEGGWGKNQTIQQALCKGKTSVQTTAMAHAQWQLLTSNPFQVNIACLKCIWHKIIHLLIRNNFQNDKEWHLFCCNSILGCQVVQDFDFWKLDDLWHHLMDTKWCKIAKCGISVYKVEILQGRCSAKTTHCDSSYDGTIATYLLPDLHLPQMQNALFVAPESNRLSCACAVSGAGPYRFPP